MNIRAIVAQWKLVVGVCAAAFLVVQIVTTIRRPNALLARADDAAAAAKLLAPERDQREDIPVGNYATGNGTVEPRDGVVRVAGAVPGRVREVRVRMGAHVSAGEALVVLDSSLEAGRVELAAAELSALEYELVAAGGGRREDVGVAVAEEAAARARERLSLDTLERARKLGTSVTEAEARRADLEAEIAAATASAASLRAQALKQGARSEVRLATRARVRAARARLTLAEAELEQRTIRAPKAGDIIDVLVRPGERYGADGDPAVLLGNADDMTVRMELDERSLLRASVGADAIVRSPSEPGRSIHGKVVELAARMGRKRTKGDDPAEPSDLRVRDVILSLEPGHRLVAGQRVTAFIGVDR